MGPTTLHSLSLKLTFAFAFSFSLSLSSPLTPRFPPKTSLFLSLKPSLSPPPPRDLAADILSLLGVDRESREVPADEAEQIRSCLRFLVPPPRNFEKVPKRELLDGGREGADEMVRWPPAPVRELARLAVDSGGNPAVIQRSLDPTVIKVPDVEGLSKDKCELTRTPTAFRFANEELNSYFAFLFKLISERAPMLGLNISLSRFHAKEYPAYDGNNFPYHMGYCQTGSNVIYDDSMNLRNILWLAPLPSNVTKSWVAPGTLVILDAHPEGIIYKKLVPEYVDYVRTIYEDDFGDVVVDVNYLDAGNVIPGDNIFIC